jgi:preprotein translocase subunit YajC
MTPFVPGLLPATLFYVLQAEGGGLLALFLPFLLVFIVFYFFIIRPQRKREDQRKAMISAVQKGDRIVTIGGIHGTVTKVDDDSVLAEVDGQVKLRFDKNAIASIGKN